MASSEDSGGGGKPSTEVPSSKSVVISRADISEPTIELEESRRGAMADRSLDRFCREYRRNVMFIFSNSSFALLYCINFIPTVVNS